MKKYLFGALVGIFVGFYSTFVLEDLWNWFVAPAFHVPDISYWTMYGIQLLFSLLFQRRYDHEEARWKAVSVLLDSCIPDEKREHVKREISYIQDDEWVHLGIMTFTLLVGATVTLILGWTIHTFLA